MTTAFIDDCVWMVLSDGRVTRAIPVGNPIHPPPEVDPTLS
jgi:hypothetical protein